MKQSLLAAQGYQSIESGLHGTGNARAAPTNALEPECCGHTYHWSEGFFICATVTGVVLLILALDHIKLPKEVLATLCLIVAATACALMWNLMSVKRLAAATDMIERDVQKFSAENEKAHDLQDRKKQQDAEMKNKLGDLKAAGMLLSGSVAGLEDIKKKEDEMLAEREKLLQERRVLADKLRKDMTDVAKIALEDAQEHLIQQAMLYFEENNENNEMAVGSKGWQQLATLLAKHNIPLPHSAAGDDGKLTKIEYQNFLDDTLEAHFLKLRQASEHNIILEQDIRSIKIQLGQPLTPMATSPRHYP